MAEFEIVDNFDQPDSNNSKQIIEQLEAHNLGTLSFSRRLVLFLFIFITLAFYLVQHNHVMTTSIRVQEIEKKLKLLKTENEKLQISIAQNISLENVDKIATNKLKMVQPNVQYLKIKRGY